MSRDNAFFTIGGVIDRALVMPWYPSAPPLRIHLSSRQPIDGSTAYGDLRDELEAVGTHVTENHEIIGVQLSLITRVVFGRDWSTNIQTAGK